VTAFLLSAFLSVAFAGGADRSVGVSRSGSVVLPEVPRLEPIAPLLTEPGLAAPLSVPSELTYLLTPEHLTAPLAALPTAAETPVIQHGSAVHVRQDDMAMPVLKAMGEDVKPGAAFTEKDFSEKFDGLRKLRAPVAVDGFELSAIDPDDTSGLKRKEAEKKLAKDQEKLDGLQEKLYAERKHRVLIVLQGMDTAGKDGVIKHVMRSLNPQGVQVHSFKKPSEAERKQHYLQRQADALPDPGMIGIFNRSHIEELILPLVHPEWYPGLTREDWLKRVAAVNAFEKEFAEKGGVIMKFFPHIDKDEQRQRLQDRIDTPEKNWKFSESDLAERRYWAKYMEAYQLVISLTNTPWAPWYAVPANNKWHRDYMIGKIVKKTLKRLKIKDPPANPKLKGLKIPA
jgi:PPK2 family polyphosphate:nucleotide phosphotransferase